MQENTRDKIAVGVLVLLGLTASFCGGAAIVKSQVITETVNVPYEVEVIRKVETIVEVIKEVEVEVVKPAVEFSSVEELRAWLAEDKTNRIWLLSGKRPEDGVFVDPEYDCDNYAEDLMRSALKDGYLISQDLDGGHIRNFTYIGNDIWVIEPQDDGVSLYSWSRD